MVKQKKQILKELPKPQGISKRGKKVMALGIFTVVIGFIVLSLADPAGANFAAHLSPFLLIAGYSAIGVGIILPDNTESETQIKPR